LPPFQGLHVSVIKRKLMKMMMTIKPASGVACSGEVGPRFGEYSGGVGLSFGELGLGFRGSSHTLNPPPYRGTSLIRRSLPLGPYSRPMPRAL